MDNNGYTPAPLTSRSGRSPSAVDTIDVSVIIPVRNGMPYLPEQLAALARQTYRGRWEVIISDNGSVDESLDAVRAASDSIPLRIVDSRGAPGAAGARVAAAKVARGQLLLFCDADDVIADDWVEQMSKALDQYAAVGGHIDDASLNSEAVQSWRPPSTPGQLQRPFGLMSFAGAGNCGFRRAVYDQAGGFDVHAGDAAAEIELCWQVQLDGYELAYVPTAVVAYRHVADLRSLMRQHRNYGKAQPHVVARYQSLGLLPPGSWRDAAATLAWFAVHAINLVRGTWRRGDYLRMLAFVVGQVQGSIENRVLYVTIKPPRGIRNTETSGV